MIISLSLSLSLFPLLSTSFRLTNATNGQTSIIHTRNERGYFCSLAVTTPSVFFTRFEEEISQSSIKIHDTIIGAMANSFADHGKVILPHFAASPLESLQLGDSKCASSGARRALEMWLTPAPAQNRPNHISNERLSRSRHLVTCRAHVTGHNYWSPELSNSPSTLRLLLRGCR